MPRAWAFRIAFLLWIATITYLSLSDAPQANTPLPIPHLDKLVHAVFYGVLTVLSVLAVGEAGMGRFELARTALYYGALALAYGTVLEGLQPIMPFERRAEWPDVLANGIGAALATFSANRWFSRLWALKRWL